MDFTDIIPLILDQKRLSAEQVLPLARLPESSTLDILALSNLATSVNNVRSHSFTCVILNAKSGRCAENCHFCAQSSHYHTDAPIYPLMNQETIFCHAAEAAEAEAARFGIVTSGMHLTKQEVEELCKVAERITSQLDIKLCGSLGQISLDMAKSLKQAGFSRLHHNLETAESYFPSICTTHRYEEDMQTLEMIRSAGLEICSGGIFGLGENWEQRIELSQTLADMDVNTVPVNFLTPISGTPLGTMPLLQPQEALRIVAILRLMHPSKDILICGGRAAVLEKKWQSLLLIAGANALLTGNYLTTSGISFESDQKMMHAFGLHTK